MVAPLREIPGITAMACATPIMIDFPKVTGLVPFLCKMGNRKQKRSYQQHAAYQNEVARKKLLNFFLEKQT